MTHPDIFYRPLKGETSGLPHDPFKSFVIPRPIGWISTTSRDGKDNLAPFSQFTNVSFDPPTILSVPISYPISFELLTREQFCRASISIQKSLQGHGHELH